MAADADIVHMSDGRKLEGTVLVQEKERVRLEMRFGTIWLQKKDIEKVVSKPLSWKTAKAKTKKKDTLQIDFNKTQRVVYYICRKYHSQLLRGDWDLKVHQQLMRELASPTLQKTAFKLSPKLLSTAPNGTYSSIYTRYLAYQKREVAYWSQRRWSEARKLRVTAGAKDKTLGSLKNAVSRWVSRHSKFEYPKKFPTAQLLLRRIGFLQSRQRQLDTQQDKARVMGRLKQDSQFYQRWLFRTLDTENALKSPTRRWIKQVTHPRHWLGDFQLTQSGVEVMKESLAAIRKDLKQETVDGEKILFSTRGFVDGRFRFLTKFDDRSPHLFRLHRYFDGKTLMASQLILRLNKVCTHLLIVDKAIWYAPILQN